MEILELKNTVAATATKKWLDGLNSRVTMNNRW